MNKNLRKLLAMVLAFVLCLSVFAGCSSNEEPAPISYLGVAAPYVTAGFIENGGFDVAGFGRTIFAYPDFAKDILEKGCLDKDKICICCSKCTEVMRTPGGTPGCVIRDKDTYLPIYRHFCGGK